MSTSSTSIVNVKAQSLKCNLKLFYVIGSSRGRDIRGMFNDAYLEDRETSLRIAQWCRDVRGGSGERQTFKNIMAVLSETDLEACKVLASKVPEIGRWDDLLCLVGTTAEQYVMDMIRTALTVENSALCAKWMPRKGVVAAKLRRYMDLSPKTYRKMLVGLTSAVESYMCSGAWNLIDFNTVPSLASARYQNAFSVNASRNYSKYISDLNSGEAKINASAVYPYDIIKSTRCGNVAVSDAQWKALPDYFADNKDANIIPVVDVSGSMYVGVCSDTSALDVALSLGLYISERNNGPFKDKFITFSEHPEFVTVAGSLHNRLQTMERSNWGMTTNIELVFDQVLNIGVEYNVAATDMPRKMVILSDMRFNRGVTCSDGFMETINGRYDAAGYTMPDLIFWNLAGSGGGDGVVMLEEQDGVSLVSGFSPSLMTAILAGDSMAPTDMMLNTVGVARYDV